MDKKFERLEKFIEIHETAVENLYLEANIIIANFCKKYGLYFNSGMGCYSIEYNEIDVDIDNWTSKEEIENYIEELIEDDEEDNTEQIKNFKYILIWYDEYKEIIEKLESIGERIGEEYFVANLESVDFSKKKIVKKIT